MRTPQVQVTSYRPAAATSSSTSKKTRKPFVPILSISLTNDKKGFLPRLLRSIDFPIKRILIQIGNEDTSIVQAVVDSVHEVVQLQPAFLKKRIELTRVAYNPGCANGWNLGLKAMMASNAEWVFVLNSDIAFQPGSLQRFAAHMMTHIRDDPLKFGVGFAKLDHPWSCFAMTRRAVAAVGLFDENFYPMYYEDDDMANRVALAGFYGKIYDDVSVIHGESKLGGAYISGTSSELRGKLTGTDLQWKAMVDRVLGPRLTGDMAGREYFRRKWGVQYRVKNDGRVGTEITCKFMRGGCKFVWRSPFNVSQWQLSLWHLEPHRRQWIVTGQGTMQRALAKDREAGHSGGTTALMHLGLSPLAH